MIKIVCLTIIKHLLNLFRKEDVSSDVVMGYLSCEQPVNVNYMMPKHVCDMYEVVLDSEVESLSGTDLEAEISCGNYLTKLSIWLRCNSRFVLKHSMSFMLIIIMLTGFYLSSAKKADAGMIVGDHRYTSGAVAADMSQCAALIAIWWSTRMLTRLVLFSMLTSLRISCASGLLSAAACPAAVVLGRTWILLAEIAAATALYYAWLELERWAELVRSNTHILNNFDEGQDGYCEKFDHRNKNYKFGPINGNYADCNQEVSSKNTNFNQIAVYYDKQSNLPTGAYGADIIKALRTGSPNSSQYTWISAYDCKTMTMLGADVGGHNFSAKRWVCAYEESGQICADVVFCTSLEIIQFIKYVMPGMFFFNKVTGYVADPTLSSSDSTRNCGSNPWSGSEQDDYESGNGRCECACCGGKDDADRPEYCDAVVKDAQGSDLAVEFSCETYNERYRAHCIPLGSENMEIDPPVIAPIAVSAYCDANLTIGYTPFPFAGKLMRCFEKTLNNVFYGTREIVAYDEDDDYMIEEGALVMTLECIEGTVNSSGFCDSSMFMKVMEGYQGLIRMMLILFVSFVGIRMLMGANYAFPDLFKMIIKVSLVAYFSMGDAWKDGYYNTLLTMGSELGAEYYDMSDAAYEEVSGSMNVIVSEPGAVSSTECSSTSTGTAAGLASALNKCSYTNGKGYDGAVYSEEDAHYAAWDMLDCKFATYTGFTVTKSFPFIVSFAWGMLLSVSTGFMTLIAALAILYSSMVIMLSALYIGIVILFNITILIYISPLVIPLVLFDSTKAIFNKWLSTLIGYSLQPMILFALLSFTYAILDALFLTTMPQIFASEVSQTAVGLGIVGYKITSSSGFASLVVSMIKFTLAMIIMSSLFTRATSILRDLTGASVNKMPDIGGAVRGAAGQAGMLAGNTAKFAKNYTSNQRNKMNPEGLAEKDRPSVFGAKGLSGVSGAKGGGK